VTDPREQPEAAVITEGTTGSVTLLDEASPVRRAAEIGAPVLMFHGRGDADFGMSQHAVALSNSLKRADKDVVFIEYPQANHEITRGPDRVDMLARIGEFLVLHTGPEG
jgi:dipeptidyl aminopeptidase/acylaminoacyl peptidase